MKTVVCAVDDSSGSATAVRVAAELSNALGARLVLVHVLHRRRPVGAVPRHGRAGGALLLDRVAGEQGLVGEIDRRVEVGDRATEVARIAIEEGAALILLGAARPSRIRAWRSNGLAIDLHGTAPCPVLVVPAAARG